MESAAAIDSPQESSGTLGLWLFIASEILLFGGFLAGYVMIRWGSSACALGTSAWPEAGHAVGLRLALLNTLILITSSYTVVRTVIFSRAGQWGAARRNLSATLLLGVIFLVIKGLEYAVKIHHGYFPRTDFMKENPGLTIFISFYYALTILHALHVLAGLIWNAALARRLKQSPEGSSDLAAKLEYAGLYWHFVDVLWIFLFPLFYLI
jgi:cytochrome c oxidase subunit 3